MYCDHLTVYATEINSSVSARLKNRLKLLEQHDRKDITYTVILGNENSTLLPSGSVDKVLIRNTYHHFSHPDKMVEDCKRILKKEGQLYIVDILTDETSREPECKFHLTRKDFLKVLNENGFSLVSETMLDYDDFKCFEFRLIF